MELELRGRPLHSRSMDVEARLRADGRWDVCGELVDVRKAGFVPIAGDLQLAGLLHHMRIDVRFDPAEARIEGIEAVQPRVAFEPSPLSQGESCRDPVRNLEALAGRRLDAEFPRQLAAAIGGARGCSHVLALGRLVGSTLLAALRTVSPSETPERAGERIFRRTLCMDGAELDSGRIELALQLTHLRFAAAEERPRPVDRLGRLEEVRALASLEMPRSALRALRAAERARSAAALGDPAWVECGRVAALVGHAVTGGMTARVAAALPDRSPGDALMDLLLQLGPAVLQCLSSQTEPWPALAGRSASRIVCGAAADSCYMWRSDGALHRARLAEEASGLSTLPRRSGQREGQ